VEEIIIPAHILPQPYMDYQGRRSVGAVYMLRRLRNYPDVIYALRYSSSGNVITGIRKPKMRPRQIDYILRQPAIIYYLDYEVDEAAWKAERWMWGEPLAVYPGSIRLEDQAAFCVRKVCVQGENLDEFRESLYETEFFNTQELRFSDPYTSEPVIPYRRGYFPYSRSRFSNFGDGIYVIALPTPYDDPPLNDLEKRWLNEIEGHSDSSVSGESIFGAVRAWIARLFSLGS